MIQDGARVLLRQESLRGPRCGKLYQSEGYRPIEVGYVKVVPRGA